MSQTNAHDAYFRETFSQPERLAGLIRSILPPEIVSRLDLAALTLLPQRYVDGALTDFQTDLVAQMPLNDSADCAAPTNLQILDSATNRSLGCKTPSCRKK